MQNRNYKSSRRGHQAGSTSSVTLNLGTVSSSPHTGCRDYSKTKIFIKIIINKTSRGKIGENHCAWVRQRFLGHDTKSKTIKEQIVNKIFFKKLLNWSSLKLKTFTCQKTLLTELKCKPKTGRKYFQIKQRQSQHIQQRVCMQNI